MPKKKKPNVQLLRREDYSAEDLRKWSEKLAELSAELQAYAAVMDQDDLKTVRVDGATKIGRGLLLVAEFAGNVTRAIRNAQYS